MKIKFLGAAGTVTGSSYILTSDSHQSILIDLGLFQGIPAIESLNFERIEYDFSQLRGAVLTHAHLDHCGRLPLLLKYGFSGLIWMTQPTLELTQLTLLDSAKIAKQDKKSALFDTSLVEQTIEHCQVTEYQTPFEIGDFLITFRDASHILGSCSVEIEDRSAQGDRRKIVFSGDLGNTPHQLLQEMDIIDHADTVVMESTYGDRLHPNLDAIEALTAEIKAVEQSGGTLLIPAFSLEKTQELLHMIKHLKQEKKVMPETPVFLDSPMATKATRIYGAYPELFNEHVKTEIRRDSPFDFPGLEVTRNHKDSLRIQEMEGTKVIIAGSGMMAGGRIMQHAARFLPLRTTRLFQVGYQGEGTLGREIFDGERQVEIDGFGFEIRATVSNTQAMSSHADQRQLLEWLGRIQGVKKVFLTHGENPSRDVLAQEIVAQLGIRSVVMPLRNEEHAV